MISINPGAPNGGSGTEYFIGDFDAKKFTTDQTETKWVNWGTDNYAGVTYNVLPKDYYGDTYANDPKQDRIFMGWMSNWTYAQDTPAEKWRSAISVPRKLALKIVEDDYSLFNYPIKNLETLLEAGSKSTISLVGGSKEVITKEYLNQSEIRFRTDASGFQMKLSNDLKEEVLLTMLREVEEFFLDRTNSGKIDFQQDFGTI